MLSKHISHRPISLLILSTLIYNNYLAHGADRVGKNFWSSLLERDSEQRSGKIITHKLFSWKCSEAP